MSEALDKIDKYKRDILRELLSQCTEKQQEFFDHMYIYGIEKMPKEKLDWAITQCENTVKKNNSKKKIPNKKKYTRFELMDI